MIKRPYEIKEFHSTLEKHCKDFKEAGLPTILEKTFEVHPVIHLKDIVASLKSIGTYRGDYSAANYVSDVLKDLAGEKKIFQDGSGRYVSRKHGRPPTKKFKERRFNFDGLASFVDPTRDELDEFVRFIHKKFNKGITPEKIKAHVWKTFKHRLRDKYPDRDDEYGQKRIKSAVSARLTLLRKKGLLVRVEGEGGWIQSYKGVKVSASRLKKPKQEKPPAKPKKEKPPEMLEFSKAITRARNRILRAKSRGDDVTESESVLNKIAGSKKDIEKALRAGDLTPFKNAVSQIELPKEKTGEDTSEVFFVPGHGEMTVRQIVSMLNKRDLQGKSLAWKLGMHETLSSLKGLFSNSAVKEALEKIKSMED